MVLTIIDYNEARKCSATSISGGYRFGIQAERISPATLNLGVIKK